MTDRSTLLGIPVIAAPHRADRPGGGIAAGESCPFCPGAESQTPPPLSVITRGDSWDLRVVPNKYPIAPAGPHGPRHEVVIETPRHDDPPPQWSEDRMRLVVGVWLDRLERMTFSDDVACALMFRNQGARGGASLPHPHSQIIGLEQVPERMRARSADSCLICNDLATSQRVLATSGELIAWCPASPLMPWEIAISSLAHPGDEKEIARFADDIASLLRRAVRAHDLLDLHDQNWIFAVAPRQDQGGFHWTLSLHPRVSAVAGFELATGTFVNIIDADRAYRDLAARFSGA